MRPVPDPDTLGLGEVGSALYGDLQQVLLERGAYPTCIYACRLADAAPEVSEGALPRAGSQILLGHPLLRIPRSTIL